MSRSNFRRFETLAAAALLLLCLPAASFADDTSPEPPALRQAVEAYFQALDRVFAEGSTVEDIDRLLGQMHESVKYEHPNYGADFTLATWRGAFVRNLERGAFRGLPGEETEISKVIVGRNAVAVEYRRGEIGEDGTIEPTGPFMALFELTDGKISRIREYW